MMALLPLATGSAAPFHVVLDPGHGGIDKGAVQHDISESSITLDISKLVAEELSKNKSFKVTLTRTDDSFISLERRADIANQTGNLFLSIHVNSSPNPKAKGKEIYFQNQMAADETSLFLANRENRYASVDNSTNLKPVPRTVSWALREKKNVHPEVRAIVEDLEHNYYLKLSSQLAENLYENWGGERVHRRQSIRQAPFFVISNINKPAALIEIGYISNIDEAKKLISPSYQRLIAQGIARAILDFKDFIDKPIKKSLD